MFFITQSYFSVPKDVRLSSTHYLIMKINKKREFQNIAIKACVCYFSLFLKDKSISSLVRTKYIEKKFTLQLFFLPTVSQTFILSWATRLLETCLEKITVCAIETMLVTLPLVQMNKAQREVNWTNQDKHCERSSNFCYTLNPWEHMPLNIKSNGIFFKNYLLVETFSSDN